MSNGPVTVLKECDENTRPSFCAKLPYSNVPIPRFFPSIYFSRKKRRYISLKHLKVFVMLQQLHKITQGTFFFLLVKPNFSQFVKCFEQNHQWEDERLFLPIMNFVLNCMLIDFLHRYFFLFLCRMILFPSSHWYEFRSSSRTRDDRSLSLTLVFRILTKKKFCKQICRIVLHLIAYMVIFWWREKTYLGLNILIHFIFYSFQVPVIFRFRKKNMSGWDFYFWLFERFFILGFCFIGRQW